MATNNGASGSAGSAATATSQDTPIDVAAELARISADDGGDSGAGSEDQPKLSEGGDGSAKTSAGGEQESGKGSASGDEGQGDGASSAGDGDGNDVDIDAILQEAGIEPADDDRKLPGKSHDEIQAEAEQSATAELQSWRNGWLKQAQPEFIRRAKEAGMKAEAADELWQDFAHDFKLFDSKWAAAKAKPFSEFGKSEALKEADAEAYELFSQNDYKANPIDMIAGAMAAGRKAERASLTASGEFVPKSKLQDVIKVAVAKAVAQTEAKSKSTSSGRNNNVQGTPAGGDGDYPRDENGNIDTAAALARLGAG